MNHAELRAVCAEVVATQHADGAGADSHRSGVAVALAAAVPALLDELEGLRGLNRRALAIIASAIMHGMPITEEVAAVRNAIVGPDRRPDRLC